MIGPQKDETNLNISRIFKSCPCILKGKHTFDIKFSNYLFFGFESYEKLNSFEEFWKKYT